LWSFSTAQATMMSAREAIHKDNDLEESTEIFNGVCVAPRPRERREGGHPMLTTQLSTRRVMDQDAGTVSGQCCNKIKDSKVQCNPNYLQFVPF
jgi:hypothetical protein